MEKYYPGAILEDAEAPGDSDRSATPRSVLGNKECVMVFAEPRADFVNRGDMH